MPLLRSLPRLLVPPIFGAGTSLGLLYLYHESYSTSTVGPLWERLVQARDAVHEQKHMVEGKIEGRVREVVERGERSRWRERQLDLSDELKLKWNTTLSSLLTSLSTLEVDTLVLQGSSLLSNLTRSLYSSLQSSTSGSATTAASDVVERAKEAGHSVVKEVGKGAQSAEDLRRRIVDQRTTATA